MKVCSKCKIEKVLDDFGNNKVKKDGKQNCCKSCVKLLNADYYKRTPEKNPARNAARKNQVSKNREFVIKHFQSNPCIDCGELDWIVLTFDHVRGIKRKDISNLVCGGYSISSIKEEIEKCEVRCFNCHQRKTAKQFGWYKGFVTY